MDTITTTASLLKSNGSALPVMVALTPNEVRLIAAAPDLLAALQGLLGVFRETSMPDCPSLTALVAAGIKAELAIQKAVSQ